MKPVLYIVTALCTVTLLIVGFNMAPAPSTLSGSPVPSVSPCLATACPSCPSCPSAEGGKSCPWVFEKYEMSKVEKKWFDHSTDADYMKSPCSFFYKDDNDKIAQTWYDYTTKVQNKAPTEEPNSDIFSKYTFKQSCTNEIKTTFIEPIAYSLRNPLFCKGFVDKIEGPQTGVVDKSYMLVDWMLSEQRKDGNGKVYLFDMGASLYNSGSGGASQSWFVSQIEERGLKLDGIWAWEYTTHDAKAVFADIPERLWPIYHWYNLPVDFSEKYSNPWVMLKQIARPEDIVIVKLDIDTPKIEGQLIKQLEDNKALSDLVDVLFYEEHINIVEMERYFGSGADLTSYSHAFNSFKKLREAGIRAHPWV